MIKQIVVSVFILGILFACEAVEGMENLRKDLEAIMRASRKNPNLDTSNQRRTIIMALFLWITTFLVAGILSIVPDLDFIPLAVWFTFLITYAVVRSAVSDAHHDIEKTSRTR